MIFSDGQYVCEEKKKNCFQNSIYKHFGSWLPFSIGSIFLFLQISENSLYSSSCTNYVHTQPREFKEAELVMASLENVNINDTRLKPNYVFKYE